MGELRELLCDRLLVLESQKEALEEKIEAYKHVINDLENEMCVNTREEAKYDISVILISKTIDRLDNYKLSYDLDKLVNDLSKLIVYKDFKHNQLTQTINSMVNEHYLEDIYMYLSDEMFALFYSGYTLNVDGDTLKITLEFN